MKTVGVTDVTIRVTSTITTGLVYLDWCYGGIGGVERIEAGAFRHHHRLETLWTCWTGGPLAGFTHAEVGAFEGLTNFNCVLTYRSPTHMSSSWHFTGPNGTQGQSMPRLSLVAFVYSDSTMDPGSCCSQFPELRYFSITGEVHGQHLLDTVSFSADNRFFPCQSRFAGWGCSRNPCLWRMPLMEPYQRRLSALCVAGPTSVLTTAFPFLSFCQGECSASQTVRLMPSAPALSVPASG